MAETFLSERFDITSDRAFEISAMIISTIVFNKDDNTNSDLNMIDYVYNHFSHKERDFAFLALGKLIQEHANAVRPTAGGGIQLGFNLQRNYDFKTREELERVVMRRYTRAFEQDR